MNHSSRLKEMGTEHDMKPFLLPTDSFTLSNAELNNKQLMKSTYSKGLTLST
jgi:pantothenate kinase